MKKTLKVLLVVLVLSLLALTTLTACDPCSEGHSVEGQPWQTDGTSHWQICSVCEQPTEKVAHLPEADDGDCTTAIHCSVCDAETTAGESAHSYGAWAVGTGDNANKHVRTCSNCGKVDSHSAEAAADDGNCLTEVKCKHGCGLVVVEAATAHTPAEIPAVPATCTVAGSTAGSKCSVCETVITQPEEVPALGHVFGAPNGDELLACTRDNCDCQKVVSVGRIAKDYDRLNNDWNWGALQTQVLDLRDQLPQDFGAVTSLKFGNAELCNAELCNEWTSTYTPGYVLLDGVQWGIPNSANIFGLQTLVATNADGDTANVQVLIVTKVIRTVDDYAAWGATAKSLAVAGESSGAGYFELGNDIIDTDGVIELNAWNNASYYVADAAKYTGFAGTFDGCGYIIDGLKLSAHSESGNDLDYSFVGIMEAEGVLKNIGFTNVDASEMNLAASFLSTTTYGTFENIYVHYAKDHKNLRTFTIMGTTVTTVDVTLTNILIDGGSLVANTTGFKMMPNDKKYDSVFGISPAGANVGYYSDWAGTHTGQIFAGYSALKADSTAWSAISAWGGHWSVDETSGKVIFGAHSNHVAIYSPIDETNHTKVCVIGGEVVATNEAHAWDNADGVVTKPASCTEAGVCTWICTTCGYKKTAEIGMLAHTYDQRVVDTNYLKTEANCHEYAVYYKSCVCGKTSEGQTGEAEFADQTAGYDATNHDGQTEIRDAVTGTCSIDGYTGDTYCLGCQAKISAGENTGKDEDNHVNTVQQGAQAPTCGVDGKENDTYCNDCQEVVVTGATIPATGDHNYKKQDDTDNYTISETQHWIVCSVCGAEQADSRADHSDDDHDGKCVCGANVECKHDGEFTYTKNDNGTHQKKCDLCQTTINSEETCTFGEWSADTATCTSVGSQSRECSLCHYVERKQTEMLAHNYGTEIPKADATCDTNGKLAHYKCSVCNKLFVKEGENHVEKQESDLVISASHKLVLVEAKASTCQEQGNDAYYDCSVCDKYFDDAQGATEIEVDSWILELADHDYEWTVVPASCVAGSQTGVCSVCNDTKTETLSAVGHVFATPDGDESLKCLGCDIERVVSVARLSKDVTHDGSTYVFGSLMTKVIDLRGLLPDNFGVVTSLTFGGTELSVPTSTAGYAPGYVHLDNLAWKISNTAANFGKQKIMAYSEAYSEGIEIEVLVVTKVIRSAADYALITATSTWVSNGGYFELGCDIKPATEGGNIDCVPLQNGFKGTIDGCGYSIDGLKAISVSDGRGGFAYGFADAAATIKNIAFTNIDLPSGLSCKFLGQSTAGTYQNIYLSFDDVSDSGYMLVQSMATAVVIDNVFADYTNAKGSASYLLGDGRNNGLDSADIYGVGSISGWKYAENQSNTGVLAGHYLASYTALKADATAFSAVSAWANECEYWQINAETGEVSFGRPAVETPADPADV